MCTKLKSCSELVHKKLCGTWTTLLNFLRAWIPIVDLNLKYDRNGKMTRSHFLMHIRIVNVFTNL